MHRANIVRLGLASMTLMVGACGFSPSRSGATGSGANSGTGNMATGIGNFGGNTSGTGGLTGGAGAMQCGAVPKSSSKLPPDILIVLDASGSMNDDSTNTSCGTMGCGTNSKWALMTPAINTVVNDTQTEVNWGLKFFADNGSCGVNNNAAVPIAPSNATAIMTAITGRTSANGGVMNGSSTPTRAAENGAVTYLTGLAATDQNPKFIVLATDGQPNCPVSGGQQTDDSPAAIGAVTAAKTAGFPTFVVGIATGGGTAETTLNSMAVEGGYPQMGAATQYYGVTNTTEFAAVLRTLVGMATTCNFSIPTPPTTDGTTSREDIRVTGGTGDPADPAIPQDANNGWTYTDTTHTSITLHGSSCDAVTAGTVSTVTIIFNCHII
jgi:von Willebrand factor type A domain